MNKTHIHLTGRGKKAKKTSESKRVKRFPTVAKRGEKKAREFSRSERGRTLTEGGVEKETEDAIKGEVKWHPKWKTTG